MRWSLSILALAAGFVAPLHAAEGTTDKVIEAYRAKAKQIETIHVDATLNGKPLISEEVLYRDFKMIPGLHSKLSLIYHHDGRFRIETRNISNATYDAAVKDLSLKHPELRKNASAVERVPFNELQDALQKVQQPEDKVSPRVMVFDGRKLWRYEPELLVTTSGAQRPVFTIVATSGSNESVLDQTIFEDLLLTIEIPALPTENQGRLLSQPAAMFAPGGRFHAVDQTESVDGADCLVLAADGEQRLWLDPKLGYALRKRQWLRDGKPDYEIEARDFTKLAEDFWFPRLVTYTRYGTKEIAEGKYVGKPLSRDELHIDKVELNGKENPDVFSVNVAPGAWVVDHTLNPVDRTGRTVPFVKSEANVVPSVAYVQPASKTDLERVIREAQEQEAERPGAPSQNGITIKTLIALNLGIVIVLGGAYLLRRGAASRRTTT